MDVQSLLKKPVLLANGHQTSLGTASAWFGLIESYLAGADTEWPPLVALRDACLHRPLDPGQRHTLQELKLVRPDGWVDPDLRGVVLAAVRGQGDNLHIDSPFVDEIDRRLSELLNSRSFLQSHFSPEEADALWQFDPARSILDGTSAPPRDDALPDGHGSDGPPAAPRSWTERLRDEWRGPGSPPPSDEIVGDELDDDPFPGDDDDPPLPPGGRPRSR